MADDVSKGICKWDVNDRSHEVIEIPDDEPDPMKIDPSDKNLHSVSDPTNDGGKRLCEWSDPKPDIAIHENETNFGVDLKSTDLMNKEDREIRRSKGSSERPDTPKLIDEEPSYKNDSKKSIWKDMSGNQGTDRYANGNKGLDGLGASIPSSKGADGRGAFIDSAKGVDGWGTTIDSRLHSRMSPGLDVKRKRSHSPSPRGGRPHRNNSGTRSRSRSRSRSPHFAEHRSDRWADRSRTARGSAPPCRDFPSGRCRRGSECRFLHEDSGRRQFEEDTGHRQIQDDGGCRQFDEDSGRRQFQEDSGRRQSEGHHSNSRERYLDYQSKENLTDSRERRDYLRDKQFERHGSCYDDSTWEKERPESHRNNRSAETCHDYLKGRCSRGASCRYLHDEAASHGDWSTRDEDRRSIHGRAVHDSSFGSRTESRRTNKNPCKFFAEGRCRRGENCQFLHEDVSQSQTEGSALEDSWGYKEGSGSNGRRNYLNWGHQSGVVDLTSHNSSRTDSSKPAYRSSNCGSYSRYDNQGQHLTEIEESSHSIVPPQASASRRQNTTEVAYAQHQQFLIGSAETMTNCTSNELFGVNSETKSSPATTENFRLQPQKNSSPNITTGENMGQSRYAVPPPPPLVVQNPPINTSFQNVTPALPFTTQMQQFNSSVLPNGQNQFAVPQAASHTNDPAVSMQGQQVLAFTAGLNQQGFNLGEPALQHIPAPPNNGQGQLNFSIAGQVWQNLTPALFAGQSQDSGNLSSQQSLSLPQTMQSTQNIQSVAEKLQDQNQAASSALLNSTSANESAISGNVGKPVIQKTVTSEQAAQITDISASLVQYFGNAALNASTMGLQPSQPNLNASSVVVPASTLASSVQSNQWPWTQQQEGSNANTVQQSDNQASTLTTVVSSTSSEQMIAQIVPTAPAVGGNNGNPVPSSVFANETVPTQNKKEEAALAEEGDGDVPADDDNTKSKETKGMKIFKCALVEFVKEELKPTWKEGHLSREAHKTIVKKVVEKVTGAVEGPNIPHTKERIESYLSYSKEKLTKLVQAYVQKYVKT